MPDGLFSKSIILNLLCFALAVAACVALGGLALQPACLFVFLLLLLCNEVAAWLTAIPTLIVMLIGAFKGKAGQEAQDGRLGKGERRMFRVASLLLLLVVPHLLFALLWGVDALLNGGLSRMLELPLGHPLFACAFVAPGLLGLIGLFTPVCPMAVETFFGVLFEPEEMIAAPPAAGAPAAQPGAATPPALPASPAPAAAAAPSPTGPRHPELQALAGSLLCYARPVADAPSPYVRRDVITGIVLLLAALFFAFVGVQMAAASALAAVAGGVGCLFFALVAVAELRVPARWRAKLARAEYAATASHVYIAEGDKLQVLPIDANLSIAHEYLAGGIGSIYLGRRGRIGSFLTEKLGVTVEETDTTNVVSVTKPLQGFIQVADAAQVLALLQQLRAQAQG